MNITAEQLRRLFPTARADLIAEIVSDWGYASPTLDTPLRVQHFFAQVGDETGGLRSVEENLTYTTAAHIRATWPSRFPTLASAQPYVRNPKELAIRVYGGRMGNAPAPSDDGWVYRGGGMLQDTGKTAYTANGHENDPEAIRTPQGAFRDAVDWWKSHDCNAFADRDNVVGLTRCINGGEIGLAQREAYLKRAKLVWTTAAPVAALASGADAQAPHDTSDAEVTAVQKRLRDLGYSETGAVDGKLDDFTQTAILAFRRDQSLPLTPTVDTQLLASLMTAQPRQVAPARAAATPSEVRAVVPEARDSFRNKIVGVVGLVTSGAGALVSGVLDNLEAARDKIAPIEAMLGDVPTWCWFVAAVAVAATVYWSAHRAGVNSTAAYQSGERR